jgi:hypothetical protein
MNSEEKGGGLRSARVLIIALSVIIIVPGLALVLAAISNSVSPRADQQPVNVLVGSTDTCVSCHSQTTPGIVEQYGRSTMASANVTCTQCHEVAADYPGAIAHEGTFVLNTPTTAKCQTCHQNEVAQFYQSRHSLPAYVAMTGVDGISPEMQALYEAIPEVTFGPEQLRNALFAIEGPDVTRFACEACHNIGRPHLDNSVGECQQCHIRHEFSLEQARKPETCNACHIGPDHPQWEIYEESPHGIAYATGGDLWHWDAEPGTLTVSDFPAPTCATCHFSGFGSSGTTHDVGDRLTWYLFAPVSERRPVWEENRTRMQGVCRECHNQNFIDEFYADADVGTEAINEMVLQGRAITDSLKGAGLLTSQPFDQTYDFVDFELWHHWGRTAKFGMWMQGADYTQWHGVYEMLSDLAELREMSTQMLQEAGIAPPEMAQDAPEVTVEPLEATAEAGS